MTILSYAKINLGLRIVRKRQDGFHDIETIFKVIDLHDTIELTPLSEPALRLSTDRPDLPTDESNIIIKAIRWLERTTGKKLGFDIHLRKNIPVGGGLGGGSSNGAAVLVHVNRLTGLGLSEEELLKGGAELGSDVPFFVGFYLGKGSTAFGSGRGERLEFFEWPLSETAVIVHPNIPISTAWAYRNFNKTNDKNASFHLTKNTVSAILSAPLEKATFFDNDFEFLVFSHYPRTQEIRDSLVHAGAKFASLSGSGSTVFGLLDQRSETIEVLFPDCFVKRCRFV